MIALVSSPTPILAFGMPGGTEWIILLVLGLLIFGRRLPEVGRSLGRGIVEFKKGIRGIEDEIEEASTSSRSAQLADERKANLDNPTITPGGEVPRSTVGGERSNPYSPSAERPSEG